jgi:heparan-alpha-glucosaminide N-acetyltransferase
MVKRRNQYMTAATSSTAPDSDAPASGFVRPARITSIDALRGLVMFTMIYVNYIAGVSDKIVPAWMKHFHGKSGMTFVDLVFPAFLFIVGMSIPFGLGSRLSKGEPLWKIILHVAARTISLLFIGILMVNETPSSEKMGWSGALWATLMYFAAILAFCTIAPPQESAPVASHKGTFRMVSLALRLLGLATLVYLAFAFRGEDGHRIISLAPFSIHTEWYGILGLIGWAYLVGAMVYLVFRGHRTALLGSAVLLLCLYPADQHGAFSNFWLAHYVGIGGTLGSQASITVAGLLLATILMAPDTGTARSRTGFTLLFIAGSAAGALLLHGLYGINKNNATPSWCLWACAITAALWLLFYFVSEVSPSGFIAKPFAIAGQNVFLAYLISDMLPSVINLLHLDDCYGRLAGASLAHAVACSAGCAVVILCLTAALNRVGFRLKL